MSDDALSATRPPNTTRWGVVCVESWVVVRWVTDCVAPPGVPGWAGPGNTSTPSSRGTARPRARVGRSRPSRKR